MIDDLVSASTIADYEKDSIVFFEGEDPSHLHLLVKGSVYVYKSEHMKNMQILRFFKPVTLFAELANIKNIPFPATGRCESDCTIIRINYQKYLDFFCYSQNHSHIGYKALLESMSDKLTYHVNKSCYSDIVELTAIQKVAKSILDDVQRFNSEKRWKIAQRLRINPETLSRSLAKLRKLQLIELDHGKIIIMNPEGLKEIY